ncbi:unnamed protein product [Peniophora sp. CBMAI 1063]|nr:unnamed protein product [Peniophora sp. CBMAI 1063]
MARNLRAKLQYAAYKVRHNVAHLTFAELEASVQRQTTPTRFPGPVTRAPAFVSASSAAANGPTHGSTAPVEPRPGHTVSTSNPHGPPPSSTESADAVQAFYTSISARLFPGQSRTAQSAGPRHELPGSKQRHALRTGKSLLDDADASSFAERAQVEHTSEVATSTPSLKRKAIACPNHQADKRRRTDACGLIAGSGDKEDLLAAAMLTDLRSRGQRGAGRSEDISQAMQMSHRPTGMTSLPFINHQRRSSARLSARLQPSAHNIYQTAPASSSEAPYTLGSSPTAASSTACVRHVTGAQCVSPCLVDRDAIALLSHFHNNPSLNEEYTTTMVREGGTRLTTATRGVPGAMIAATSNIQDNGRNASL